MDSNLTQRKRGLEEKIPDIKKTLSMVEFLRDRRVRHRKYTKALGGDVHFVAPPTFSILFRATDCLINCLFSLRRSFRKGAKQQQDQAQAALMILTMTNSRTRMNTGRTTVASPYRSRRPLSSRTRSTRRPSSTKRTLCIYGSGYTF